MHTVLTPRERRAVERALQIVSNPHTRCTGEFENRWTTEYDEDGWAHDVQLLIPQYCVLGAAQYTAGLLPSGDSWATEAVIKALGLQHWAQVTDRFDENPDVVITELKEVVGWV